MITNFTFTFPLWYKDSPKYNKATGWFLSISKHLMKLLQAAS